MSSKRFIKTLKSVHPISYRQLQRFCIEERLATGIDPEGLLSLNEQDVEGLQLVGLYVGLKLCGFAVVRQQQRHLEHLYVGADQRRVGLASMAVKALKITSVWVASTNKPAVAFYLQMGFRPRKLQQSERLLELERSV